MHICRFAQFFLCPLFDESCKDREVNAVDSEHEKNLMNDAWRLFQLEKATGNPNHPFSKFGTGGTNDASLSPINACPGEGPLVQPVLMCFQGRQIFRTRAILSGSGIKELCIKVTSTVQLQVSTLPFRSVRSFVCHRKGRSDCHLNYLILKEWKWLLIRYYLKNYTISRIVPNWGLKKETQLKKEAN